MGQALPPSHADDLCTLMASAQKKGELCDLKLVCDGQTITIHKLVACLQSPVIKAACTGSFKEASGKYEMKDCEFASVQRMVDFFYNGDYEAKPSDKSEAVQEILVHVNMFTLADMYLIDGLRTLSQTKFQEALTKQREPSAIPQYVRPVYDLQMESSKSLRDAVIETVRLTVAELPFDWGIRPVLDRLTGDIPEFAKDLAMSYIQRPQSTTGRFSVSGEKKDPRAALLKSERSLTMLAEASNKGGPLMNSSWRMRGGLRIAS